MNKLRITTAALAFSFVLSGICIAQTEDHTNAQNNAAAQQGTEQDYKADKAQANADRAQTKADKRENQALRSKKMRKADKAQDKANQKQDKAAAKENADKYSDSPR